MNKRIFRMLPLLSRSTALALLALGLAGCEVSSASSAGQAEIQINPGSATLTKGQAVEFKASGWTDYSWSLSEKQWGTLSHQKGDRTVYTCVVSTGGVQVLLCSSTISATGGVEVVAAEALIVHK